MRVAHLVEVKELKSADRMAETKALLLAALKASEMVEMMAERRVGK